MAVHVAMDMVVVVEDMSMFFALLSLHKAILHNTYMCGSHR